jgi:hypothetical protein
MELPRQCAWCRRTFTPIAIDEPPRRALLVRASHGLCPECAARQFARREEEAAALGDTFRALHSRRLGLCALAGFIRRRAAATRAAAEEITRRSIELRDRAAILCAHGGARKPRPRRGVSGRGEAKWLGPVLILLSTAIDTS